MALLTWSPVRRVASISLTARWKLHSLSGEELIPPIDKTFFDFLYVMIIMKIAAKLTLFHTISFYDLKGVSQDRL